MSAAEIPSNGAVDAACTSCDPELDVLVIASICDDEGEADSDCIPDIARILSRSNGEADGEADGGANCIPALSGVRGLAMRIVNWEEDGDANCAPPLGELVGEE